VVVIAISVKKSLNEPGLEKVWIAFGQGGNFRLIPVHKLVNTIGPEKASGLPFFHVMRHCVCFPWLRKEVCMANMEWVWRGLDHLHQTQSVCDISWRHWSAEFRAVCCGHVWQVQCRYKCERCKTEFLHSQTEAVWCNTTSVCPQATFRACCLPRKDYLGSSHSPSTCHKKSSWLGWSRRGDTWQILWTDILSVAARCRELTRCDCRKDCCGRCKCLPSGLNCTALRSCLCEK